MAATLNHQQHHHRPPAPHRLALGPESRVRALKLLDLRRSQEEEEEQQEEEETEEDEDDEDEEEEEEARAGACGQDLDPRTGSEDHDVQKNGHHQALEESGSEDWTMSEYLQSMFSPSCSAAADLSSASSPNPQPVADLHALHRNRREKRRGLLRDKFQVFGRTSRSSRPTILNAAQFFRRFDDKEKEAIAAFNFLDDMLSSSCPASPVSLSRESIGDNERMDRCYFFPSDVELRSPGHQVKDQMSASAPPSMQRPASWSERMIRRPDGDDSNDGDVGHRDESRTNRSMPSVEAPDAAIVPVAIRTEEIHLRVNSENNLLLDTQTILSNLRHISSTDIL